MDTSKNIFFYPTKFLDFFRIFKVTVFCLKHCRSNLNVTVSVMDTNHCVKSTAGVNPAVFFFFLRSLWAHPTTKTHVKKKKYFYGHFGENIFINQLRTAIHLVKTVCRLDPYERRYKGVPWPKIQRDFRTKKWPSAKWIKNTRKMSLNQWCL